MRKFLTILTLLILNQILVFAQKHMVTGIAKDEYGKPVTADPVIIKGTSNAASANAQVEFGISAKKGDVLVINKVSSTDSGVAASIIGLTKQNDISTPFFAASFHNLNISVNTS